MDRPHCLSRGCRGRRNGLCGRSHCNCYCSYPSGSSNSNLAWCSGAILRDGILNSACNVITRRVLRCDCHTRYTTNRVRVGGLRPGFRLFGCQSQSLGEGIASCVAACDCNIRCRRTGQSSSSFGDGDVVSRRAGNCCCLTRLAFRCDNSDLGEKAASQPSLPRTYKWLATALTRHRDSQTSQAIIEDWDAIGQSTYCIRCWSGSIRGNSNSWPGVVAVARHD